jgi:hypothetical protein
MAASNLGSGMAATFCHLEDWSREMPKSDKGVVEDDTFLPLPPVESSVPGLARLARIAIVR